MKKKVIKQTNSLTKKIQSIYDTKMDYFNKMLNSNNNYKLAFTKLGNNKVMKINNNNKTLLIGNHDFYGIYQPKTNLWIWASSIPGVERKTIANIKKIKSMNILFESNNDPLISFYYQLLTQDVLLVDPKYIQAINDLLLYLTDDIAIFNPTNSEGNLQFLTLKNIREKYI